MSPKGVYIDDMEALVEAVGKRLEGSLEKLQDSVDKCVLAADFVKVKCAVRVNRYEIDKLNQYSRRENVRLFGLAIDQGKSLTETVISMFNHIARLDAKCKDIETSTGKHMTRRHSNGSVVDESEINLSVSNNLEEGLDESYTPFSAADISTCHPIKGKKPHHIVRFVSRNKLMVLFSIKKRLSISQTYKGVFISDDLTPLRLRLKDYIKESGKVSKLYTRDGNIHCLFKNKDEVISSPDDLFKIELPIDFRKLGLEAYE